MSQEVKDETREHLRQITGFWNWLPAFRVVAETEHLPSASQILGVSASALSRMIKLLEEHLDYDLFVRTGRGIRLTTEGEVLLRAVRRSMRTVHEGLIEVRQRQTHGRVRISSLGLATRAYIMPAVLMLRQQHPNLVPVLLSMNNGEACDELLKGGLDVAFTEQPLVHSELDSQQLCRESHSIYCGVGHPLFGLQSVTLEEVLCHPFCGPATHGTGASPDGWPADVGRNVAVFAHAMQVGIDCCRSGALLGVLPDVVAGQIDEHQVFG